MSGGVLPAKDAGRRSRAVNETRRARIAFVGVDPDARGGIAQFGANLVRSAGPHADTFIVSYRRLYPSFTRPGRQGPDPTRGGSGLDGMPIIVPWERSTWHAAADALDRFRADLVVLQWWSPLFAPSVRFLARRARAGGARVAIVCHNDRAHEAFPFGRSLTRAALSQADVLLTLSSPVAERVRALVPAATVRTLHHPPNMPGSDSGEAESVWRHRLGAPTGPVILFFGNVRKYKGLADLIDAMPLLREKVDATLVVAGTFFEPVARYRAQVERLGLRLDREVRLMPGYVPRDQVPGLFSVADVVALPYRSASQSGVIAQAALAQKPVVVTAVGGLPEALDGRGVVVAPQDPAALAAGIVRALEDPPPPPSLPEGGWDAWREALLVEVVRPGAPGRPRPPASGPNGPGVRGVAHETSTLPEQASNGTATLDGPPAANGSPAANSSPRSNGASMVADRDLTSRLGQAMWEVVKLNLLLEEQASPVAASSNGVATIEAPPVARPQEPEPEPQAPPAAEQEVLGWRRWPIVVFALALGASVASAVFVHATGRAGQYYDAPSHLLHGRRVFDSVTPGFGQIGNYWPPLQHFAELPFVWFDPLYRSMWAGSLPAMAFYVIAVMGAYRLGVELTRDRRAGVLAALALGANPSLLYLQSTAMLESAIAMSLVWVAACLVRFHRTGRFRDVVVAGLWSSIAVWSTWGAAVLPLYGGLVVAFACRRHGYSWRKAETFALAYALAAGYALVLWGAWNFYIQHDVLYTLHYSSPVSDPLFQRTEFVDGHPGDPGFALLNFLAAAVDILGPVAMGLMIVVALAALLRRRVFHPAGPALLGGALLVAYLTFRGTAIGSPVWADLNGLDDAFARNHNVRYGLWLIPFVSVAVAVLAGRTRLRQATVLLAVLGGMVWFLPSVHGVSTIDPPAQSPAGVRWEKRVAGLLHEALAEDQHSVLLMSSVNGGDRLIWRSRVDASRFVTEFNGERFDEALRRPVRHASWVLLAPGSSVAARYEPSELKAMGYEVVWSHAEYDRPSFRYALLRRGPA